MCQTNCDENFEIKMLVGRIHRLHTQKLLIDKLLGNNRQKRGLINAIRSVSKTLFGTLTESELDYINLETDNLYKDNKILANSISNQTKIIKTLLSSASVGVNVMMEHSKENIANFNRMKNQINNNTRNLFIKQKTCNRCYQYILINEQRTVYVPTNKNLLNDYKDYNKVQICQRFQPTYLISETHTCENQITTASIKSLDYKICQVSPFRIELPTYFTLTGNQGYILIPENELLPSVNCPSNSEEVIIREATLIRSTEDCVLNSESNIIKLKKTLKFARHTSYRKNIRIPISSDEYNLLQDYLLPLLKPNQCKILKRLK